jgi:hypothetical protein
LAVEPDCDLAAHAGSVARPVDASPFVRHFTGGAKFLSPGTQPMRDIDGSYGEGGGQLLRMACALAAVTGANAPRRATTRTCRTCTPLTNVESQG